MRIWITADLHHGHRKTTRASLTRKLADRFFEEADPGDAILFGGDVAGADLDGLAECFGFFDSHPGPRAFVPGNHDLWSIPGRGEGTWALYPGELARIGREHGFHLLDQGPLRLDAGIGLAGSYGHYDFSLGDPAELDPEQAEEVREGWRSGRFRKAFWNDYRYMWAPDEEWNHRALCTRCVRQLDEDIQALEQDEEIEWTLVVTHTGTRLEQIQDHPYGIGRPRAGRVWFLGIGGSRRLGEVIEKGDKVRLAVCGHTHHFRCHEEAGTTWLNIGCTYERKRWLVVDEAGNHRLTDWVS